MKKEQKKRRPKIYPFIEYPGLTVGEQIALMKELNIYSPEIENIFKYHPKVCPECGKKYFPSGSHEVRCWNCSSIRERELTRKRVYEFRKKHNM